MDLAPDSVLGVYRVVRLLGRGGMGAVYEVEHLKLGVRYAMKVFTRTSGDAESLRRRFLAEGRLLARLEHPRLVHVHDLNIDEATGLPYFVMDLVLNAEGRPCTLEDARRAGTVTEEQAAGWFDDLREGLAYIASAGVVHRDVKLENVLIGPDGRAVLSDFGISRIFNRDLRTAAGLATQTFMSGADARHPVMGTIGYIAPEVKGGAEATAASDGYALGVLMFRLLTGIWYENGTDAFSLLEPFELSWGDTLAPLLAEAPEARSLPMEGPHRKMVPMRSHARWWALAALGALAGLGALMWWWRTRPSGPSDDFDSLFGVPADWGHWGEKTP